MQKIVSLLHPNELFIQLAGNAVKVAFYHDGNSVVEVSPDCGIGVFQDSIAFHKPDHWIFSFSPIGTDCMDLCRWSSGLRRIYFDNIGVTTILANSYDSIELKTGVVVAVEHSSFMS